MGAVGEALTVSSRAPRGRRILAAALIGLAAAGACSVQPVREAVTVTPRTVGDGTVAAPAFDLDPYRGVGAWLDVFDWSVTYTGPGRDEPAVGLDDLDVMAAMGVRTVYIQTARYDSSPDVLEPERLEALTSRASALGMATVGWYLPTFVDVDTDLRRLLAAVRLGLDGVAVDIEARDVTDQRERSRRLVELSERLRAAVGPGATLGAIVVPITVLDDVNPDYWSGFPWAEVGRLYDVVLPMNYWTNRLPGSPWRDATASTAENVRRIRERTGRADLPVHMIGGLAAEVTGEEVAAMRRAAARAGALGVSLYDYATTAPELWTALAPGATSSPDHPAGAASSS